MTADSVAARLRTLRRSTSASLLRSGQCAVQPVPFRYLLGSGAEPTTTSSVRQRTSMGVSPSYLDVEGLSRPHPTGLLPRPARPGIFCARFFWQVSHPSGRLTPDVKVCGTEKGPQGGPSQRDRLPRLEVGADQTAGATVARDLLNAAVHPASRRQALLSRHTARARPSPRRNLDRRGRG